MKVKHWEAMKEKVMVDKMVESLVTMKGILMVDMKVEMMEIMSGPKSEY